MGKKKIANYLQHTLSTGEVANVPANRTARREWARKNKQPMPEPFLHPIRK